MGQVIGIIPARGGSVRVPLKNIRLLNGKPLIAYTIECAVNSKALDRIIVSTDHEGIANVSKQYGAEVPFRRPADLSADVETELVLQHAVRYLEETEGVAVDAVVLLQPTSPFRRSQTIAECVRRFRQIPGADAVVTVTNVEGFRPEWMLSLAEQDKIIPYNTPFVEDGKPIIKLVARQSFPTLYKQNGVVYVTARDVLMNKGQVIGTNSYAVVTEEEEAIDIDTETDFQVSEALMRARDIGVNAGSRSSDAVGLLNGVQLIVYDFDGVMTDNKVMVDGSGNETVSVNRSDGLAISMLKKIGIKQLILSTEKNPVVRRRARKVGLPCLSGVDDKKKALVRYLATKRIPREKVAYVGNDLNDLEVMKFVGCPIAPADAVPEVKSVATLVTLAPGGGGVVRELLDLYRRSPSS